MSETIYNCVCCGVGLKWELLTQTPEGNLFCASCWEQFKNEPVRKCPVDGAEMKKRLVAGVINIDVCPACSGTWFDRNELEVLLKRAEEGRNAGFFLGCLV
jgi:hypothetical protein